MILAARPNLKAFLLATLATMAVSQSGIHAQMTAEPFSYNADITPSVNTWEMTRHGSLKPSLYTGTMVYSLSLYTYSDEDFSIPISLEYSYSGYRPAVHSGAVALGWTLGCGGAITREVRGLPDETSGNDAELYGYWYTVKNKVWDNSLSGVVSGKILARGRVEMPTWDPYNFNLFTDEPYLEHPNQSKFDLCPDLFHFNFLGNCGEFMLDKDGKVRVFNTSGPSGEYSIEMDMEKSDRIKAPEFRITTGDGYTYTFSGDPISIEYNFSQNVDIRGGSIAAWRLRKITAPNGNEVEFVFDKFHQRDITVLKAYSPTIEGFSFDTFSYATSSYERRGASTYYPLIKAIKINSDTLVRFEYKNNDFDENTREGFGYSGYADGNCFSLDGMATRNLTGITVTNRAGRTIESIVLGKTTIGNARGRNRVLLQSVTGNSFGRYEFEYNTSSVPCNDTDEVDHWGYWNGKQTTSLIANLNYKGIQTGGLYEQFNTGFVGKDPDITYARNGSLKRITYPTGGHTDIEYEQNTAKYLIDRKLGSILDTKTNTTGFIPGGLRVKSLTTVSDGQSRTIGYEYSDADSETGSSGILMKMPRYAFVFKYDFYVENNPYRLTATGYSSECFQPSTTGDPEVAYSHVRERYPDGSYIDYHFSTWVDFPDEYMLDFSNAVSYEKTPVNSGYRIGNFGDDGYYTPIKKFLLPAKTDYRSRRGKLVSRREYASNGNLVRETTNNYTVRTEMTQSMVYNTFVDFTRLDWRFVSTCLQSTYDSRYDGNDESKFLLSYTGYTYNERGQKVTETIDDGSAGFLTTYYKYYSDEHEICPSHLRTAVTKMARTKDFNGSSYVLSVEHLDYDVSISNPNPVSIRHYAPEIPYINEAGSLFMIPSETKTRNATFEYNSLFRPVRANLPGGAFVSYEWDEGGTHIIGKTVNSGSNKWTFDWIDMIGLKSERRPSGSKTTYGYDDKNRLERVNDPKGNAVVSYMYHLNNE